MTSPWVAAWMPDHLAAIIVHLAALKKVLAKRAAEMPAPVAIDHRAVFGMVGRLDSWPLPQVSSSQLAPVRKAPARSDCWDCQASRRDRTCHDDRLVKDASLAECADQRTFLRVDMGSGRTWGTGGRSLATTSKALGQVIGSRASLSHVHGSTRPAGCPRQAPAASHRHAGRRGCDEAPDCMAGRACP